MSVTWKDLGKDWLVEDPSMALGWAQNGYAPNDEQLSDYLHMQLAVAGLAVPEGCDVAGAGTLDASSGMAPPVTAQRSIWSGSLLSSLREKNRLLSTHRAAIDQRIESFLNEHLSEATDEPLRLPHPSLCLDRHGMGRRLSLPADKAQFSNELLSSYRVHNGVVHNPRADRRTTQGTFHVCEGGLPIPADKRAVPKRTFVGLFQAAVNPPDDSLRLPYSTSCPGESRTFASLLIRPLVCPAVAGFCRHKTMEVRFFAPGGLVSNLDFVESIFGNAGDPLLPENDAGLDVLHWSGHTGCVILAPHLCHLTKKELGLPHWDQASERQRRDSMCYRDPAEKYNDGSAFKVTCRTADGIIVTLIADNYFGYCKKEVKTQISYAANLMGNVEEEHAGGTLALPSWSLGDEFQFDSRRYNGRTFDDVARDYADFVAPQPEGYGLDRYCDKLVYIPEHAKASLLDQRIHWQQGDRECSIRLEPNKVYMAPSGYQVRMERHPSAKSWRLIGTSGEGIVCHKPCTVSGGGKSEISKSLRDYMLSGPIFVSDIDADLDILDQLFSKDYSVRWRPESTEKPDYARRSSRPLLDPQRSLGSVIKLLTPSRDYTDQYNAWLKTIPGYIYAMAFIIKRFSKPEWQGEWRKHFSVDIVNGEPGHELKFNNRKLVGMYLRVGLDSEQRWQTYKLRQDFAAAQKIQLEDDITASVVVPGRYLAGPGAEELSYKFVANCEYRLFQRPDDAVHRGLDKQTEADMAQLSNFFCNFEPLDRQQAVALLDDVMHFENYTPPMKNMLEEAVAKGADFVVSSAHPRIVDGKPSKNPRYLQNRPDLMAADESYIVERSMRLLRSTPSNESVHVPVTAVLSGRRNNPPEKQTGIRSLAVYNPIHYQELPELFMDYICSLTGKSPSTTGAGSEGALTKGPFNALLPIYDLNTALVSMILTRLGGFSTAAGHIGSYVEVGHDVSYLVPELWCRLTPAERDPDFLIREGMLEKLEDYDFAGRRILASRLGYRITARFVRRYFGRMFDNPDKVFDARILCPETQDADGYADGIEHIVEAQARVARNYFDDGSWEVACPPLKIVLSTMVGDPAAPSLADPKVRSMFTRESLLASDWYRQRLDAKRQADIGLWQRHASYLENFCAKPTHQDVVQRFELQARVRQARERLDYFATEAYVDRIRGTLGVDPSLRGS